MGNTVGCSNFRGAVNAAAISERMALPGTTIGALYAMMRASSSKRVSRNSTGTASAQTFDAPAFPAHADEVIAWRCAQV